MRGTATAHAAASTANWINGKARFRATFSAAPSLVVAPMPVDSSMTSLPSRRTSVGDALRSPRVEAGVLVIGGGGHALVSIEVLRGVRSRRRRVPHA